MRSIYAKSRDNARTPMQWSDGEQAGFTTGKPWMKINPNYKEINAQAQIEDKNSIFHCYKKLVEFRKKYPVFVDGSFEMLLEKDENIFAYTRDNADSQLLVVCNFYGKTIACPNELQKNAMELILCNYEDISNPAKLRPFEARVYFLKK